MDCWYLCSVRMALLLANHSLSAFPPFLVGSTSYLGLRVAPVHHTLSSLQIHARYHPLMAGGTVCSTSRRYCLHTRTQVPAYPSPPLPPPPSTHTMKGVALVSSYIAAALTTRRCIDQRKRNRQLLSRKTCNRGSL